MSLLRLSLCIGLASSSLLLVGCGEATFEMAPVSGSVQFSDGSIPTGEMITIRFEPQGIPPVGTKVAQAASGDLQSDGSYTLKTHTTDGAAVGKYEAHMTVIEQYGTTPPKEYRLGDAEVKSGESNVFPFKVDKASAKVAGQ